MKMYGGVEVDIFLPDFFFYLKYVSFCISLSYLCGVSYRRQDINTAADD
jgi:hypothetical protein